MRYRKKRLKNSFVAFVLEILMWKLFFVVVGQLQQKLIKLLQKLHPTNLRPYRQEIKNL